jgi:hypothetical protein
VFECAQFEQLGSSVGAPGLQAPLLSCMFVVRVLQDRAALSNVEQLNSECE